MTEAGSSIEELYRQRQQRFEAEAKGMDGRARMISNLRLVAFLGIVAALLWPVQEDTWIGGARILLLIASAIAFITLVIRHSQVSELVRRRQHLGQINLESRMRLAREWDALPAEEYHESDDPEHPYAAELALFGRASLFTLLGTAATPPGVKTLKEWLLEPSDPGVIKDRQAAVKELAPELDLRQQLNLTGRLAPRAGPERLEAFLAWSESGPQLSNKTGLVWMSRALPVLTLALIGLNIAGLVSYVGWGFAIVLNLALYRAKREEIEDILLRAFAREQTFRGYGSLFELIGKAELQAAALRRIQSDLSADGEPAQRFMQRFERILQLADARNSMFGGILQALLLWDFRVVLRLESWKEDASGGVRRWFAALGELEALAALASLAHDNPEWAFPVLRDDGVDVLEAKALGHPLLSDDVRVDNDVDVGPRGTFLMVTGSNMSGKSTLLRAIGLNVILAQTGGPACAKSLKLPPLRVQTTMQVYDSLEQGLSHFMAELTRLKAVVVAARRASAEPPILLYLLDDVLQGTNTAERQIAARRIISHLLGENAIGTVTTHDLSLAETEELSAAHQSVHFTEAVEKTTDGPRLSFDYKLRPGIATSRNALKLVEIVGLGTEPVKPEAS